MSNFLTTNFNCGKIIVVCEKILPVDPAGDCGYQDSTKPCKSRGLRTPAECSVTRR